MCIWFSWKKVNFSFKTLYSFRTEGIVKRSSMSHLQMMFISHKNSLDNIFNLPELKTHRLRISGQNCQVLVHVRRVLCQVHVKLFTLGRQGKKSYNSAYNLIDWLTRTRWNMHYMSFVVRSSYTSFKWKWLEGKKRQRKSEAATRTGSFRASKWAPTWHVWPITSISLNGQPASSPIQRLVLKGKVAWFARHIKWGLISKL